MPSDAQDYYRRSSRWLMAFLVLSLLLAIVGIYLAWGA